MNRSIATLSVLSMATLLTGCFGGSAPATEETTDGQTSSATVDMNADGSMHIETDEGTFDMGNEKVPSDWPADIAVYEGATVEYSLSTMVEEGMPGSALVLSTKDDTATVVAFYKAKLAADGWNIERTLEDAGTTLLGATKDKRVMTIGISGGEGMTSITIGVGQQ